MALADTLKKVLGTTMVYEMKAHQFHWNTEGAMFVSLHKLFGNIYEDANDAVDPLAEYIRALQVYAPTTLARMLELSVIEEQSKIPSEMLMVKELLDDGQKILELLVVAFDEATKANEQGIANFIADRMSSHGKYNWQLRSLLK